MITYIDKNCTIEYLEHALEKAKKGELTEFVMVGKLATGESYCCATRCDSSHELAGRLLDAAMYRLHYARA